MRIFYREHNLFRDPAWVLGFAVVLAFIFGTIVDIDHPIAFYLGIPDGRFLLPYFNLAGYILVGCGIVCLIACTCRCSWIRFLKSK